MQHEIVSTVARPDLAEVTGLWRWGEFLSRYGGDRDAVLRAEREGALGTAPLPRTLVSLDAGRPVGMASLAARDLEQRPDLGPWLGGVYVLPGFRGSGHATALVRAVEALARASGIPTLWLYTRTAESLYGRCGWSVVERFPRNDRLYALMTRRLDVSGAPDTSGIR